MWQTDKGATQQHPAASGGPDSSNLSSQPAACQEQLTQAKSNPSSHSQLPGRRCLLTSNPSSDCNAAADSDEETTSSDS
ncbi:hypothetical protein CYMTET_34028 [Cymbomonas tetramitiformis]|uniref:Uncharacterized protein n=1 Tax=Cymbomonas tetramitiformis TaxID=36881 RepID=A0AAE0KQD0_9CHLO|nr:hypothetical protein CYMTET_34028 [Cymbomonas tetramitiformis]